MAVPILGARILCAIHSVVREAYIASRHFILGRAEFVVSRRSDFVYARLIMNRPNHALQRTRRERRGCNRRLPCAGSLSFGR